MGAAVRSMSQTLLGYFAVTTRPVGAYSFLVVAWVSRLTGLMSIGDDL